MSFTKRTTVASGAWSLLTDSGPGCIVQLNTPGPVLVHLGQSEPAANSTEGVVLTEGDMEAVAISGMETGDAVYARCIQDEQNLVTVMSGGTAPVEV